MKDLTPPGASYVSSRGNGTWPFFFFVTNFVLMPIFFKLASEEMSASTAIDSSCQISHSKFESSAFIVCSSSWNRDSA